MIRKLDLFVHRNAGRKTKPTPLLHFPSEPRHFLLCNEKLSTWRKMNPDLRGAGRRAPRGARPRSAGSEGGGGPRAPGSSARLPGARRGDRLSLSRGRTGSPGPEDEKVDDAGNPEAGSPAEAGPPGAGRFGAGTPSRDAAGAPLSSEFPRAGVSLGVPRPSPDARGAQGTGGGPAHVGAGGGPRGARGGRAWFPRLPGGVCMCVWQPQTSCSFYAAGTRRPGRRAGGRRARQDAGTSSPGRHRRLPATPRRLPLRGPLALPGRAARPAPRWGRAPARPRGHRGPRHRAPPGAAAHPRRPGSPEGRSHERDVQLPAHRGHRLPVRRGLRQRLHQHFGVSELEGGAGGEVGPWGRGPGAWVLPPAPYRAPGRPPPRGQGSGSPLLQRKEVSVCPGRSRCPA